jgi:hypothetical protein
MAIHAGPGRTWLMRDDAAAMVGAAKRRAAAGEWSDAAQAYDSALAALPPSDETWRRRLEVELGKALVMSGDIVEGQERLEKTLVELDDADQGDSEVARAARYELATASYYAAWIMRLEGATAEEWLVEAEVARQNFRLLAEGAAAESSMPSEANDFERSLEATIKLEQMDLSELLARPRPKNCPNCKNGLCQKKRKQSAGRCQSEGKKPGEKEPQDARQEIKKTNQAGLYSGHGAGS